MMIYKWLGVIVYLFLWAWQLIYVDMSEVIDLLSSYAGYHAIVLHFTIYLVIELLLQIRLIDMSESILCIRQTRMKLIMKKIMSKAISAFMFSFVFYGIYSVVLIIKKGVHFYVDNQICLVFVFMTVMFALIYFIFNLIQGIVSLYSFHQLLSLFVPFLIGIVVYFGFEQIMVYLEIFEQVYLYGFVLQEYLNSIFVLLFVCFILSIIYMSIFIKKDLIYENNV